MRFSAFRLAAVLLLAVADPLAAQLRTRTTPAVTEDDLRLRLGILADDSMLGRDAGQIGNVRATDYIAAELRRMGLEPAGEGGSWFQTIPLVARSLDDRSTLRYDGGSLAYGADFLPLRPVAGNPFGGTFRAEGAPVVYGGRIGAPDAISPDAARGRVVIFAPPVGPTGQPLPQIAGTGGALARYAGAAAVGIAALDLVPPPLLGFLRQVRVLLVDTSFPQPAAIPAFLLTTAAAERLLGGSVAGLTPGASGRAVSGSLGFLDAPTPAPARNVIGIVRGRDAARRGTYVAVGAHSDHVGIGPVLDHDSVRAYNAVIRPLGANDPPRAPSAAEAARIGSIRDSLRGAHSPRPDSIFNGADDDASGSAVALELAEYFVRNRPARSLLFVFHTAEEKGLFGAAYYTDHPTVPRDSIVAQINMDQVSRGGPDDVPGSQPNTLYLLGTRRLSTELGDIVEAVNGRGHNLRFDYSFDADGHPANGYCRSDHYMYARYGIPIAFVSAGWHRDYHMVTDETAYANVGTMFRVGQFARDLVATVANLDHRPVVDKPRPDPRAPCRQ